MKRYFLTGALPGWDKINADRNGDQADRLCAELSSRVGEISCAEPTR
jgi:hypothetical protein